MLLAATLDVDPVVLTDGVLPIPWHSTLLPSKCTRPRPSAPTGTPLDDPRWRSSRTAHVGRRPRRGACSVATGRGGTAAQRADRRATQGRVHRNVLAPAGGPHHPPGRPRLHRGARTSSCAPPRAHPLPPPTPHRRKRNGSRNAPRPLPCSSATPRSPSTRTASTTTTRTQPRSRAIPTWSCTAPSPPRCAAGSPRRGGGNR